MTGPRKIPWQPAPDELDDIVEDDLGNSFFEQTDMLSTMFAQQELHALSYHELAHEGHYADPQYWGELNRFDVQEDICKNAFDVVKELSEAVNQMGKRWKQTPSPINEEEFREELADVWHFWIQLHIVAGIDPITVFKEYFRKSLVNEHRRESGY